MRLIPRFPFYRKGGDYITSLERRLKRIEERASHLIDQHILLGGTETVISKNGKQVELTKADYMEVIREITKEVWQENYTAKSEFIPLLRNCRNESGAAYYLREGWLSDRTRK